MNVRCSSPTGASSSRPVTTTSDTRSTASPVARSTRTPSISTTSSTTAPPSRVTTARPVSMPTHSSAHPVDNLETSNPRRFPSVESLGPGAPLHGRGAYPGRQGLRKTQPPEPSPPVENCQRAPRSRLSMPNHRLPRTTTMPPPPRPPPVGREQSPTPSKRPHEEQQRGSTTTDEDPQTTPRHLPRVLPPLRRSGRPRDPPRRGRSRPRGQPPPDPRRTVPPCEDSSGAPASDRSTSRPAELVRSRSGWGTTAAGAGRRVKGGCAF